MDRVLRNSKKSSILTCGNTHESASMKALFEIDNLFSLTSYFTTEEICKEFLAQQRWGGDRVCALAKLGIISCVCANSYVLFCFFAI